MSKFGTIYSNAGVGWSLAHINDSLGKRETKEVFSLYASMGYRYFFKKDLFAELDVSYSQYIPNLIDTPYIYTNNEITAMLGVGIFVPGIYQGLFELID